MTPSPHRGADYIQGCKIRGASLARLAKQNPYRYHDLFCRKSTALAESSPEGLIELMPGPVALSRVAMFTQQKWQRDSDSVN